MAAVSALVTDRWQRCGIGSKLVTHLARTAIRRGIHEFRATLLAGNLEARRLIHRIWPDLKYDAYRDGCLTYRLPLPGGQSFQPTETVVRNRFAAATREWEARLGKLRDLVRQEVLARQLDAVLPAPPLRVLDVGCGQGTQALRLARQGYRVTGLDPSTELLARLGAGLARETPEVWERLNTVEGSVEQLTDLFEPASFDVVLAHGLLMYFADPGQALRAIGTVVKPGGTVSLLVRNGDALAMRPGLLGHWTAARDAFGTTSYVNRIGVEARADRLEDLTLVLGRHQMSVREWYGVRVFTDAAPDDAIAPTGTELAALLDCEERAGRTDPYRGVAALIHVVAHRR